jgi:hypothetical protein
MCISGGLWGAAKHDGDWWEQGRAGPSRGWEGRAVVRMSAVWEMAERKLML